MFYLSLGETWVSPIMIDLGDILLDSNVLRLEDPNLMLWARFKLFITGTFFLIGWNFLF